MANMVNYDNTKTIYDLVVNAGEAYSEKLFLRYEVNGDIVDVKYDQFITECKAVISWVQEYSVKLGRVIKVGLYGGNSHPYFVTLMAVMAAGSVAVPLDVQMNKDSLADALDRADVDVLFYDYAQDSIVQDIKDKCPKVKDYFIFRNNSRKNNLSTIIREYTGKHFLNYAKEEDLAMILFTSGTTGKSKGVMLSQRNLVDNIFCSEVEHRSEDDIYLNVLPIHHVFCINGDLLIAMRYGDVLCLNQELSKLAAHILMFQPTKIRMVPMIAKTLYNRAVLLAKQQNCSIEAVKSQVYGNNLKRIVSGGGYLPPDLAKNYEAIGIQIRQGYGMSECSPKICAPDWDRIDKVASVGKVVKRCEIRTVEGEIQVKSPSVMMGYYKDPERTKEALTEDGWLRTGDLGYVDDENYLYLTGRKKNLIILSNGENVAPEPIESMFVNDDLVEEIVVLGDDDVVAAEIYPNYKYASVAQITDIEGELNKIIAKHNEELTSYQKILRLYIRDIPFEKTSSKKIIRDKNLVRDKKTQNTVKKYKTAENATQKKIYNLVAKVLGNEDFGVDTSLYEAGLDSLGSVMLISDLYDELELKITLDELMQNDTVEKLESFANSAVASTVDYTKRDVYPLTSLQTYFAYIMRGNTTANLPFLFKLGKGVDLKKLKTSIEKLLDVHPELKDVIQFDGKAFMNFRDDKRKADIKIVELSDAEWAEVRKGLVTPYMYGQGDLLYHICIYKTQSANYLFFDIAHIMGDGMSMNIVFEDLNRIYAGEKLPVEKYTFYEFILDEKDKENRGLRAGNMAYFEELMKGYKIKRALFTNKNCYALENGQNAAINGRFETLTKQKIVNFCKSNGISENAYFLTAFNICTSIFSGTDDTVTTTIHSGRTDSRWNRLTGPLFLTYLFRYQKKAHETVKDLLKKNSKQIMNTMRMYISTLHADEMFFQYQGDILEINEIGGEEAERQPIHLDSLPFHLQIMSDNEGYRYLLRFWKNRMDTEQLNIFMLCYESVLEAMLEEASVRRLRDAFPVGVFPLYYTTTAAQINFEAGENLIIDVPGETKVKVYVFDEKLNKQPFGGWGELYVVGHPTIGYTEKIKYPYDEPSLYRTGKIARILPNGDIDILEKSGRTVMSEGLRGRHFLNLNLLEKTLMSYDKIDTAECYIAYGENNAFYLTADIRLKKGVVAKSLDLDKTKDYVKERAGETLVPAKINILRRTKKAN